jgi:hypothetical protein
MNIIKLTLFAIPLLLIACGDPSPTPPDATSQTIDFTADIKPLLKSQCLECHNTRTLLGHLNLETRKLAFTPGPNGPFLVPGKPLESALYTFTEKQLPDPKAMPPTTHRLSDANKQLLYDWIAQGANWPDGPDGTLTPLQEPSS